MIIVGVLALIVLSASCVGIYLLTKFNQPYSNQVKIVMSISLIEILISISTILIVIIPFSSSHNSLMKLLRLEIIRVVFYFFWYIMFYILMIDRLLGSCFPFWYRTDASKKLIKRTLIICWLGMIIILISLCLWNIEPTIFHGNVVWLILDSLFILSFFVLYSSIFYIKYRSKERSGRTVNRDGNKRFLKITSVILTVFLLLEAAPTAVTTIAYATAKAKPPQDYRLYSRILWHLNLLADPVIYIFMHPYVSVKLARYFSAFCRRSEDNNIQLSTNPVGAVINQN